MQKKRSVAPAFGLITFVLLLITPATGHAAAACTLSAVPIVFGSFSGSPVTVAGQITIHCTGNGTANYSLQLSAGSGTYASRTMRGSGSSISYNLYTDSAFSQIWGDGTSGTVVNTGVLNVVPPNALDINVTVFAKLPLQPILPPSGSYIDTIVANLTCTGGTPCAATTTFDVTESAQAVCTISANSLNFGAYRGPQIDSAVTLLATCSSGTSYNVGLNQGVSAGASVTTRKMTRSGGGLLSYGLFSDSSRTTNWGNTVGTDTVSATGTGVGQSVTVFGRVPASQPAAPGTYQDTITATLFF
jgi:spore coat protein U-like protein